MHHAISVEIFQRKYTNGIFTSESFGQVGRSSGDFTELREHAFREMLTKCLVSSKLVTQHCFIHDKQPSFSEISNLKKKKKKFKLNHSTDVHCSSCFTRQEDLIKHRRQRMNSRDLLHPSALCQSCSMSQKPGLNDGTFPQSFGLISCI